MKGTPAVYLGRIVSKENFRAYIYAPNGSKKVANSWEEYQKHMASGLWFSTKQDAITRIPVEKPRRAKKHDVKKASE